MMNGLGWNSGMMNWGWGYGGGITMILVIAALIIGAIVFVRWLTNRSDNGPFEDTSYNRKTAKEVLDERYANGEISREEYIQMKKDLCIEGK